MRRGIPRVIAVAWRLTKGYRLHPWDSPFLKWRIETWSGMDAGGITPGAFLRFCGQHRRDLLRYLKWADENSRRLSACW